MVHVMSRMIITGTVLTLVSLNAGNVGRSLDDVDVAGSAVASPRPASDIGPRRTTNVMNMDGSHRLTSANPVRIGSTPDQQDAKVKNVTHGAITLASPVGNRKD
jgi:hypothetical protein